jgi:hypothetical protein
MQLEKIAHAGCRVDFNQGLDARLVTGNIAKTLSRIKWLRYIRFAYDSSAQAIPFFRTVLLLKKHGIGESRIFVYILLTELENSYMRIHVCKELGVTPFAQPYRDFTPNQVVPQWQIDMARWCNDKAILKSCDFKDYHPRKGFYCREYFNN